MAPKFPGMKTKPMLCNALKVHSSAAYSSTSLCRYNKGQHMYVTDTVFFPSKLSLHFSVSFGTSGGTLFSALPVSDIISQLGKC